MYRALGRHEPTKKYDHKARDYMEMGNLYEQHVIQQLHRVPAVSRSTRIANDLWEGRADVFIDSAPPRIVEVKATGDKWWDYQGKLPYPKEVAQAAFYGVLYKETVGITPITSIYYKAWGHYAEFELTVKDTEIEAIGWIDDVARSRTIGINIARERKILEDAWQLQMLPARPSKYIQDQCTFRGSPNCTYFGHCWEAS